MTVDEIQETRAKIDEITTPSIKDEATLEFFHNVLVWIAEGEVMMSEAPRAASAAIGNMDR